MSGRGSVNTVRMIPRICPIVKASGDKGLHKLTIQVSYSARGKVPVRFPAGDRPPGFALPRFGARQTERGQDRSRPLTALTAGWNPANYLYIALIAPQVED
jgi:hypothetical protein